MGRLLKILLATGYSLVAFVVLQDVLMIPTLLRDPTNALGVAFLSLTFLVLGLPWSLPAIWSREIMSCGPSVSCPAARKLGVTLCILGLAINMGLLWWWALRKSRAIALVIVGLVVLSIVAGFGGLAYYLWRMP